MKRPVLGLVLAGVLVAAAVVFLTYPRGIAGGTQLSVARELEGTPQDERIVLDAADLEQNCPELDLAFERARHDGSAGIGSSRDAEKAMRYLDGKYGQGWRQAIVQWEGLDYRISVVAA